MRLQEMVKTNSSDKCTVQRFKRKACKVHQHSTPGTIETQGWNLSSAKYPMYPIIANVHTAIHEAPASDQAGIRSNYLRQGTQPCP